MFARFFDRGLSLRWMLALALALSGAARADEDGHGARVPLAPKYVQECSACHVAYSPRLLPAASWQRLMSGLSRHYGTDASLDPATVKQLSAWLTANADTRRREAPAEDRITRSAWFVHEHDEIAATTWKRASIRSPSNCIACHVQAEKGDFNEHNIRIPR